MKLLQKIIKPKVSIIMKYGLLLFGMNNLPDFLIIGSQKAGTQALLTYLNQHPSLIGARKSLYFFNTNYYNNGLSWYKRQLPIRRMNNKIFEKTASYSYYPETPKRIHDFNKNMKLILIMRDPVKRAFSGWNHYRKYYNSENSYNKEDLIRTLICHLGQEKAKPMIDFLNESEYKSFNHSIKEEIEAINNGKFIYNPSFVRRGIYHEQVSNYLQYFEREQILLLESSELRNDKERVLNELTEFLEIPPFDFSKLDLKDQHMSNYRSNVMDQESREILKKFYEPYNEKLYDLIGKRYDW